MAQPLSIFDVAGRAMSAQLVRLNTTASNLANAGGVAGSEAEAYRTMKPVFKTTYDQASGMATVDVDRVVTAVYDNIVERGFGRAEENESDEHGVTLANKTGYAPAGLNGFLTTLKERNMSE